MFDIMFSMNEEIKPQRNEIGNVTKLKTFVYWIKRSLTKFNQIYIIAKILFPLTISFRYLKYTHRNVLEITSPKFMNMNIELEMEKDVIDKDMREASLIVFHNSFYLLWKEKLNRWILIHFIHTLNYKWKDKINRKETNFDWNLCITRWDVLLREKTEIINRMINFLTRKGNIKRSAARSRMSRLNNAKGLNFSQLFYMKGMKYIFCIFKELKISLKLDWLNFRRSKKLRERCIWK